MVFTGFPNVFTRMAVEYFESVPNFVAETGDSIYMYRDKSQKPNEF
jgi:hypothetical protein